MKRKSKAQFWTYQLQLGNKVGDLVKINSPWDMWGRVIELRENGFNLIRGVGNVRPEK